jgi:COX assembly mitochondrial protein 2
MHPPLDRPHPDCEDAIRALRTCHLEAGWKKYLGACNAFKFAIDRCFKEEKNRLLADMDKELPERKVRQEEIVKNAFGQTLTFSEYLQQDKEYRAELSKKAQSNL